mgnify:CR=1 FL=1
MKVFLDTNVVIDYLAKRQPFAEDANRMITLCCQRGDELCMSALSFTTVYYVLKKQYGHQQLLTLLSDMCHLLTVCAVDGQIMQQALLSGFTDFEDAVQCYTASACNASVIVTRNVKDFSHSPLLAKTPAEICEILQGYNFRDDSPTLVNEPAVPYGEEN